MTQENLEALEMLEDVVLTLQNMPVLLLNEQATLDRAVSFLVASNYWENV